MVSSSKYVMPGGGSTASTCDESSSSSSEPDIICLDPKSALEHQNSIVLPPETLASLRQERLDYEADRFDGIDYCVLSVIKKYQYEIKDAAEVYYVCEYREWNSLKLRIGLFSKRDLEADNSEVWKIQQKVEAGINK